MYALYFIAPIAALVAVISYAIGRINKQSYLHTPIRIPGFRKAEEESVTNPAPDKKLTRKEQREQAYVEWYTQRNTAIHQKREEKSESVPKTRTPEKEPEVFVGVAIVHEEPVNDSAHDRPERNIDRWYRSAVSA